MLIFGISFNQFFILDDGAGGAGGGGGASDQGDQAGDKQGDKPVQKFVERIDPVTQQKVKIPAELDSLFGHIISKTRTETESQFKPIMEKLKEENADLGQVKEEMEKLRLANLSAEERAQENAKKVILEHEKKAKTASEEATIWKGRFETSIIKNDILSSFGDVKLCNPGQVAILFESEGRAKPSEIIDNEGKPTNEFEARVTLTLEDDKGQPEVVEGTPRDLFKRWIKLDRNSHHVMNELTPGSGARTGRSAGSKFTDEQLAKMSPTERMKNAREQVNGK